MDIVMLFPQSFISDSFEKVDFNINVHGDYKFFLNFWNFVKIWKFWTLKIFFFWIMKCYENWNFYYYFFEIFEILKKNNGFLDSDDNVRGSRITITVVCPISDVQLKILRKLFKLPVNSSVAVNSLENYGPVNSLSVKNVKQ
jgi:hypothetical protein